MHFKFPINNKIIENYPLIKSSFNKELKEYYSQKQIFRLLDNSEQYKHIKNLVEFIEKFLSINEFYDYVKQKINSTDNLTFSNNLKELFLLDYLLKKGFKVHTFDSNKSNKLVPEFYVSNSIYEMLIELYSPRELYGFEKFFDELVMAIKYFPKDLGFNCVMEVECNKNENEWIKRAGIPIELDDKYSDDKLRHADIQNIVNELFNNVKKKLNENIFYLTDDIYISALIKFNDNYNDRQITYSTPSYDSVRNYVLVKRNSKGIYKKLLHKIKAGQLNTDEYPCALRLLFVDFSHSMGSEVLVEGMGEDFLSEIFYDNLSQRLKQDVSNKNVDLIFPIICGMNENLIIGRCVFNAKNINAKDVFNVN